MRPLTLLSIIWVAVVSGACDGDAGTCPAGITQRCAWNEATGQYDRACQTTCAPPTDAGAGACQVTTGTNDAGQAVQMTTYYSNDPRLQECRK